MGSILFHRAKLYYAFKYKPLFIVMVGRGGSVRPRDVSRSPPDTRGPPGKVDSRDSPNRDKRNGSIPLIDFEEEELREEAKWKLVKERPTRLETRSRNMQEVESDSDDDEYYGTAC